VDLNHCDFGLAAGLVRQDYYILGRASSRNRTWTFSLGTESRALAVERQTPDHSCRIVRNYYRLHSIISHTQICCYLTHTVLREYLEV
jgi:hypothetical protein